MSAKTWVQRLFTSGSAPEEVDTILDDMGGGKYAPRFSVVNSDGTNVGSSQATGIGATSDAAATDSTSSWSVVSLLKGLFSKLGGGLPASLGQKAKAASLPVVLASDQDALALAAGSAIIGKVGIDQTTPGTTNAITSKVVAAAAAAHRSAIAAADVLAAPGTVTCTKLTGVGSATAGVYTVVVAAVNDYGRTTGTTGNATVTTETTNLGVRAAFAAVSGATKYDIYMSTAGAAAAFVGRVTEAQRASGIIISAQNVTSAGGAAGAVDIYVAGTGLAVNGGQLAQNVAYTPEGLTAIDPAGATNIDIDVLFSRTGDSVAAALVLVPFYEDTAGTYAAGDPITLTFGGASSAYWPNRQTFRCPARGRKMVVVVASIAGTGAAVTINAVTT